MTKLQSVSMRFLKGFIAGGLASVAAVLVPGIVVTTPADLSKLGFTLLIAFLSGGILGLEKLLNWKDVPTI